MKTVPAERRTSPLLPAALRGRWVSCSVAGIAVLAVALTVGHLRLPPRRHLPLLVTMTDGCVVPAPTSDGDLAATVHTPTPAMPRAGRPARPLPLDLASQLHSNVCEPTRGRYDAAHHRAWDNYDDQKTTRDAARWYADNDSGAGWQTRLYLLPLTRTHAHRAAGGNHPPTATPHPLPDRRMQSRHSSIWLTLHASPCDTDSISRQGVPR